MKNCGYLEDRTRCIFLKKKYNICETHKFEENVLRKNIILKKINIATFLNAIFIIAFGLRLKYFSYNVAIIRICQKYLQNCELKLSSRVAKASCNSRYATRLSKVVSDTRDYGKSFSLNLHDRRPYTRVKITLLKISLTYRKTTVKLNKPRLPTGRRR